MTDSKKPSWICQQCTYPNTPETQERCNMCGEIRKEPELIKEGYPISDLKTLKLLSKIHDIKTIIIYFDGSGDSGSINDFHCLPTLKAGFVTYNELTDYKKDEIVSVSEDVGGRIKEMGYSILEKCGFDWYNNEGGYGDINIKYEHGKATYSVEFIQRVMQEEESSFKGVLK